MLTIRIILHPTDFSSRSVNALEVACALARERGARLVLLHVVPAGTPVTGDGDAGELERAERFQSDLKSYRDEMSRKLARVPVPLPEGRVERLIEEGPVGAVVVRLAHERPCDLIVMGTHGRTGELGRLMGSVAGDVSRGASCPVLTVRDPAPVAEGVREVRAECPGGAPA
jgi:nucleotide-binding universal stress UspA family protein